MIPNFGLGGIQKAGCVLAEKMAAEGHNVWVVGEKAGPRLRADPIEYHGGGSLQHRVSGIDGPHLHRLRSEMNAEVTHIHCHGLDGSAAEELATGDPDPGLWVTPVFGRPPADHGVLDRVGVCCVGVYTLYRFLRWLGRDPQTHDDPSIMAVPLTPYLPPEGGSDDATGATAIEARRVRYGLRPGLHRVVGRLGRDHPSKWHPRTPGLVRKLLAGRPETGWLSVGLPAAYGAAELRAEFGNRFVNLPETSSFDEVARILGCLDVQVFLSPHGECFASSICEAAGLGTPTIAYSSPLKDNGQAEQAFEGRTGFLVATDEQVLAHLDGLEDDAALARLRASTRAHCLDRWHVDRSAADLLAAYRHRLAGGGPPPIGFATLREELRDFAAGYRDRVTALPPDRMERAKLRIALRLAENWSSFRAGRRLKTALSRG